MVCLIMNTVITNIRLLRFGKNIVTLRSKKNLINAPLDYESSFQKAPILLVVILNKCPGAHSSKYAICFFQNLLSLSAVNVEGQISSQVKPVINRPGLT